MAPAQHRQDPRVVEREAAECRRLAYPLAECTVEEFAGQPEQWMRWSDHSNTATHGRPSNDPAVRRKRSICGSESGVRRRRGT